MIRHPAATRRFWRVAGGIGALLVSATVLPAQSSALSVSGSPATMTVSTALAGSVPNPQSDATTTYTFVSKGGTKRGVQAQLNAAMPAGVTLTVTFAIPAGATNSGPVTLDATARTVFHGSSGVNSFTGAITYQLSATPAAGVVSLQSRTVTFTELTLP